MKAVFLEKHGGPEVLQYGEVPTPEPGPGEVRVAVACCAVNHLDIWVRRGMAYLRLKYPHILGADVVGWVDALGPGVQEPPPGTLVAVAPGTSCGTCERCLSGQDNLCPQYGILGEHRWGGYAEYVVVPRANLLPYPEGLAHEEVASMLLVFLTAWEMVEKAQVEAGQWALVMAAGSGVSTALIQILRLRGVRVIAAAGSREKVERALELGAEEGIVYREEDLVTRVREIVGKAGVPVIFDHTGKEFWSQLIRACAWGGRIVTCGATSGYQAELDLRHVFFRQISIRGSTMGSRSHLFKVLRLAEQGVLKAVVDRVLPLEEAAQAHRLLEERKVFGKVVLRVRTAPPEDGEKRKEEQNRGEKNG